MKPVGQPAETYAGSSSVVIADVDCTTDGGKEACSRFEVPLPDDQVLHRGDGQDRRGLPGRARPRRAQDVCRRQARQAVPALRHGRLRREGARLHREDEGEERRRREEGARAARGHEGRLDEAETSADGRSRSSSRCRALHRERAARGRARLVPRPPLPPPPPHSTPASHRGAQPPRGGSRARVSGWKATRAGAPPRRRRAGQCLLPHVRCPRVKLRCPVRGEAGSDCCGSRRPRARARPRRAAAGLMGSRARVRVERLQGVSAGEGGVPDTDAMNAHHTRYGRWVVPDDQNHPLPDQNPI